MLRRESGLVAVPRFELNIVEDSEAQNPTNN